MDKFATISATVLLMAVLAGGCIQNDNREQYQPAQSTTTLKGFSLSPKSFQQDDFTEFFETARLGGGGIISWNGDWNELGTTGANGAPYVIAALSSKYGYTPLIELQLFSQDDGMLIRQLNETTRERYKESVVAFSKKCKPEYIAVGIEVNVLYEKSPEDFREFAGFYEEVYDAVKAESPNTKIFTVFQLEKMKGLNGGLFGGENNVSDSQWHILERFPKADIIAFTTYPGLVYKDPSEIPKEYYSEIRLHTSKPVAFTEVGWHSSARPIGWESNGPEQAEFVGRFFNLTHGLGAEFTVWSFLYDQDVQEPFNSMGLRFANGTMKQAWDAWIVAG